jgi:hypothetical protein
LTLFLYGFAAAYQGLVDFFATGLYDRYVELHNLDVLLCVCVCVCERERERERSGRGHWLRFLSSSERWRWNIQINSYVVDAGEWGGAGGGRQGHFCPIHVKYKHNTYMSDMFLILVKL